MIAIGDSQIIKITGLPSDLTGLFEAPAGNTGIIQIQANPQLLTPSIKAMLQRHGGSWNMVYCDGHVEHGGVRTFFDWSSDEVVRRWNRDNQPHRVAPNN
jgi:prepilin-type processing-associated H-X9-DG protein